MKKQISEILKDLYSIDPELKNHEESLKTIIANLLASKPDTKFDESFAKKLRSQLLTNIPNEREETSFAGIFNNMKKLYLAAGAVMILALIAVPVVYYGGKKPGQVVVNKEVDGKINIKKTVARAFGSLATQTQTPQEVSSNFAAPLAAPEASRDQSGGGGTGVAMGLGGGGGGMAVDSKAMFAPEMYTYKFVYKGEKIDLAEKEMEVLQRIKGLEGNNDLVSMIKGMNFGLIDLGSLQNAKLQNISITEDRDFGYSAYIDFIEGMVSINENWLRWRQPWQVCQGDEKCFQDMRIKESDIPADQDIIAIADDFVKKYNISTDVYGPGEVDNAWRLYYNQTMDKASYYFPDTISVVYPLIINGKTVYDEGGNKAGFRVNVNIREKMASSAYGLSSRQYESSMYETEIDTDKILSFAERGGWNRRYTYYAPEQTKTVDIEIGTPELAYVNVWRYDNVESKELTVPALLFPVLNVPEGAWVYERNIIVPLVVDLLNEAKDQYPYPILMKEEVSATDSVQGVEVTPFSEGASSGSEPKN